MTTTSPDPVHDTPSDPLPDPLPDPVSDTGPDPVSDAGRERFDDAAAVRPYTLTGGRTRPVGAHLPVEALVRATAGPAAGMPPERRAILERTRDTYLSVAELSAHLHLPVGVVRVVVGDLVVAGAVALHGVPARAPLPATTTSLLESVLDGIASL